MKKTIIRVWIICILLVEISNGAFPKGYANIKSEKISEDAGDALFLTPLIEGNQISEAQAAAEVKFDGFKNVTSYAGYFTVNKTFDSNLFFWFFPSESDYENDPVVLWLQGGPGSTSLYGLFTENGPFVMKNEEEVELRNFSWTKEHSVLYIDNPVGTGFSFTKTGYAENQTKVGEDLYEALQQFFRLFPNLQDNEFYITGESYAGKYVPAISYAIYKNNRDASLKINLKGLAIGDGLCDPVNQLVYSDYLYQIGLIDINTKEELRNYEQTARELIREKDYENASDYFYGITDMFQYASGFSNVYNFLYPDEPDSGEASMGIFLQSAEVRAAIHVGNTEFDSVEVEEYLYSDITKSIAPWLPELLNNYRVLFYNGQVDIIVAYPLTVNFLQALNFTEAEQYANAPRYQWHVDDELAGYVKQAGNLTEILVRAAGHMVPYDQPKWAYDLIYRFTRNEPFHPNSTSNSRFGSE